MCRKKEKCTNIINVLKNNVIIKQDMWWESKDIILHWYLIIYIIFVHIIDFFLVSYDWSLATFKCYRFSKTLIHKRIMIHFKILKTLMKKVHKGFLVFINTSFWRLRRHLSSLLKTHFDSKHTIVEEIKK